jgi:hypothetical protein
MEWLEWRSATQLSSIAGGPHAGSWHVSGGFTRSHGSLWQGNRLSTRDHLIGRMGVYVILKGVAGLGIFTPILAYFHMDPGLIGPFFADNIVFHCHPLC